MRATEASRDYFRAEKEENGYKKELKDSLGSQQLEQYIQRKQCISVFTGEKQLHRRRHSFC